MNWNYFYCYLSGRHDFGVRCEPGEIYLRCIHCGRRSQGWALKEHEAHPALPAAAPTVNRHAAASKRKTQATRPAVASA